MRYLIYIIAVLHSGLLASAEEREKCYPLTKETSDFQSQWSSSFIDQRSKELLDQGTGIVDFVENSAGEAFSELFTSISGSEPKFETYQQIIEQLPPARRASIEVMTLQLLIPNSFAKAPEGSDAVALMYGTEAIDSAYQDTNESKEWATKAVQSLVSFHIEGTEYPLCNGAIISGTSVVTARHCLDEFIESDASIILKIKSLQTQESQIDIQCPWKVDEDLEVDQAIINETSIEADIGIITIDVSALSDEARSEIAGRAVQLSRDTTTAPEAYSMAMYWPKWGPNLTTETCGLFCYGFDHNSNPVYPNLMERYLVLPGASEGCNNADSDQAGTSVTSIQKGIELRSCPTVSKLNSGNNIVLPGWAHTCPQPKGVSGAPFFKLSMLGTPEIVGVASVAMSANASHRFSSPENCLAPSGTILNR